MATRGPTRKPLEERFWPKVNKDGPGGCWIWTAATSNGYGVIGAGGRKLRWLYAHRVSWELHNGPIPDALHVLHHCDNPPCVNPAHLFLGTPADNMADRDAKGRHGATGVRGERNGNVKLTETDVLAIRSLLASGISQSEVARRFGVTSQNIGFIDRGRTWVGIR